ncbi:hypothetical protein [Gordonia sp. (in: high G+C Gram-positive bacteria)]|uniref:hypothetical protein n=1 Tax=Gordonia sp. (in: high G+C Gram-positive bacteria) TaxID=84139 RepID=UPI0033404AF8
MIRKTITATLAALAITAAGAGVATASDIIVTDLNDSNGGAVYSNDYQSPGVTRCPKEGAVSNSWTYVGTDDNGQPIYKWVCHYADINQADLESN